MKKVNNKQVAELQWTIKMAVFCIGLLLVTMFSPLYEMNLAAGDNGVYGLVGVMMTISGAVLLALSISLLRRKSDIKLGLAVCMLIAVGTITEGVYYLFLY